MRNFNYGGVGIELLTKIYEIVKYGTGKKWQFKNKDWLNLLPLAAEVILF